MVDALLVCRRVRVLVQRLGCEKLIVADVALPVPAIECTAGSSKRGIFLVPFSMLVGKGTIPIPQANFLVDCFSVQDTSLRTGS